MLCLNGCLHVYNLNLVIISIPVWLVVGSNSRSAAAIAQDAIAAGKCEELRKMRRASKDTKPARPRAALTGVRVAASHVGKLVLESLLVRPDEQVLSHPETACEGTECLFVQLPPVCVRATNSGFSF